jgi:hypothetical protein
LIADENVKKRVLRAPFCHFQKSLYLKKLIDNHNSPGYRKTIMAQSYFINSAKCTSIALVVLGMLIPL